MLEIKEIKVNPPYSEETIKKIIPDIPDSEHLMEIAVREGIKLAFIITDSNDRKLFVSQYGAIQIDESYTSERMDRLDLGLVSSGLYDRHPELSEEKFWDFDAIVTIEVSDIVSGEKMIGYHLLEGTNSKFNFAKDDLDYDAFNENKNQAEEDIYLAPIEFDKNGKFEEK